MKSVSMGKFQYKNQVSGEFFFAYLFSNFTIFQPRSWTDFRSGGIMSSQVVWKLGQNFRASCHIAVKLGFDSIFRTV